MNSATTSIRVRGLGRSKLAALRGQARKLGISAESYAKQLIEDGLTLEQKAKSMSFDEIFAPAQARFRRSGMSEAELDALVDRARTRHHRRQTRRKR